jgi:thioredoxin reductase (NADPH)
MDRCPELGDIILQAFLARRHLLRELGTFTGVRVIGSRHSRDTFRIRDFLAKNRVPFSWIDLEADADVRRSLTPFGIQEKDTPVVGWRDRLLRNPSNRDLADALGIHRPLEQTVYDLAVVGGGPAGLAAAVYGASEGCPGRCTPPSAPGRTPDRPWPLPEATTTTWSTSGRGNSELSRERGEGTQSFASTTT